MFQFFNFFQILSRLCLIIYFSQRNTLYSQTCLAPQFLSSWTDFSFDRWCWTLLAVIHNVSVIAPSVVRPDNKTIHLYGSFISSWCRKPFLPHSLFLYYDKNTVNTIYQGFPNGVDENLRKTEIKCNIKKTKQKQMGYEIVLHLIKSRLSI